jgi:hypothetical protein
VCGLRVRGVRVCGKSARGKISRGKSVRVKDVRGKSARGKNSRSLRRIRFPRTNKIFYSYFFKGRLSNFEQCFSVGGNEQVQ